MASEIEIKTERLTEMLSAENLGGVLINSQANFAWLTGGRSNGINSGIENGACFLLVRRDGKKFVLANNIEMPRLLSEEISAGEFEPVEFIWQDEKISGDLVFEKTRAILNKTGEIATDLLLHPKFRAVENLIARCRYSLTEAELERYKNLGKDAGEVFRTIFENIAPGATEIEIARKTKHLLAKRNIDSIVTLVGADERIAPFRHPVPTANVWKKVLLIAVCVRREGLTASLSRIICDGRIPDELQSKTESVSYVFAKFLAATKPGVSGAEIYQIAAWAYAEKGFAGEIDLHHQGGAAGYKTRDWVAHPASAEVVRENQAFAWNPSITGTKAEETAIVSADGKIEIVTATPDFPKISTEIDGQVFFSPGILSL